MKSITRVFDETNVNFCQDKNYNALYLRHAENYFNCLLKVRAQKAPDHIGRVWLNEIYDYLGFDLTEAGHFTNFTYNMITGEGYVDFSISQPASDCESFVLNFDNAKEVF